MQIGYKLYEGAENFAQLQLEMALTCEANGWCMEDGYDGDRRYLIINPPVEPSLEELKKAKLQEVDSFIASKITGGFVSLASGEPVTYDSDKDTQITMQGIALNVQTPLFATEYPNGCPVRGYPIGSDVKQVYILNAEQVMRWCADLSMHIGSCKQRGWELQAQVNACTTKEELEAIVLE
jgi:hypothetical protein